MEILESEALEHLRLDSTVATTHRSYLSDGRCVSWVGPGPARGHMAIDAEFGDAPVPPSRQQDTEIITSGFGGLESSAL